MWIANTVFGGSFTSRLNQNLRERNGFTYGAGSACLQGRRVGVFTCASSVKAETTGSAVREFLNEFARMKKGDVLPEELTRAVATQRTQGVKSFEEVGGAVATYSQVAAAGLPPTTIARIHAALGDVTADDVNAVGARYMTGSTGVLVMVGDRGVCLPLLEGIDLPVIREVDEEANPV